MMKLVIECSVLWTLVLCVVAQPEQNDASNLQHVVSEILRRLDEKDTQIEKLQQRLAEQEKLNAKQNNRLADQDAVIDNLQQRLRELESKSAPPAESIENAIKSLSSNKSANRFAYPEKRSVRKGK